MAHSETRANEPADDGVRCDNGDDGKGSANGQSDESPWSPGELLAHDLDADPDTFIRDAIDRDAWESFRTFRRRYAVPITDETTFADLSALWPVAWHACGLDAPTHSQVAEFLADYAYPLTDPLVAGEQLEAARRKRFADRDRIESALKPTGIPSGTEYTLAEVERVCGVELAHRAMVWAFKHNRMTWSAIKPHHRTERTDLITAAELVAEFGVEPSTVITHMTAATADEKLDALERLTRSRKHYAKFGAAEEIDVAGGMVSPGEMRDMEPPRPMLGHLLFCGQLSELIGPPGSGKTFVALDMGLTVASGKPGIGRTEGRVRVLYVAAEAAASVYLRVLGWCVDRNVTPESLAGWFTVYPQPVQLGDPEHMRQVRQYAADNGIGLIVFDTRHMVTLGLDENDSGDQGVAIMELNTLNRAGVATLVVHHTTKDRTMGAGGRGSGAWFGAAYTSMHLDVSEKRNYVVCDKIKDDESGCKHVYKFADVHVPEVMMPKARKHDTRAVIHPDPLSEDDGVGSHGLNATQLDTLYVVATLADDGGLTGAELEKRAETCKADGRDIGKRPTIFKSLKALRGEMPGTAGKYLKTVKTAPAASYRASDAGWDLLVSEGMVTQEYADTRRHTVEDVGQQPNRDAVANIRAALEHLTSGGEIIPGVSTPTDAKRLVKSHMADNGQTFGEVPWSEAYPAWKADTAD